MAYIISKFVKIKVFGIIGSLFLVLAVIIIEFLCRAQDHLSSYGDFSNFITGKEYNDSIFYIIDCTIDLNRQTVRLPQKAILEFKCGYISNGMLIGDSSKIIVTDTPIFDNIILEGSWKVKNISTDFFKNIDNNTPSNLTSLLSDYEDNVLSINHDLLIPIKQWSSNLIIKSNTLVELNADLFTLPTEHKGGYCMNIVGHDIKVNGNGHFLFGTIACADQKECPQWLHGLNIDRESQNVIIEDINSWLFCGDGFYNSGSDVTLDRINAKFNGRQGLSITNGKNIKVKNSSFKYTGLYRINNSGGPGAGIDIEPNKDSEVDSITINNCRVTDNYRYMKGYVNDLEIYGTKGGSITVNKCVLGGMYLGFCNNVKIIDTSKFSIFKINDEISGVIIQ